MNRKSAAMLVVACFMIAGFCPVIASDTDARSTVPSGDGMLLGSDDAFSMEQDPNGAYTFTSDFITDTFKVGRTEASEVIDPLMGMEKVAPLELVQIDSYVYMYNFDRNGIENTFRDYVEDYIILLESDQGGDVGFPAALSSGMTLQYDDPDGPYARDGFNELDWYCYLWFQDRREMDDHQHLRLMVTNGPVYSIVDIDQLFGTTPYYWRDILDITTMQFSNLFNWCVGDFDGNGADEIAISHKGTVGILGLNPESKQIELMDSVTLSAPSSVTYAAVGMSAGDIDFDGRDELFVTHGYYGSGGPGHDESTDLIFLEMDPDGDLSSDSYTIGIRDPTDTRVTLDSVMTSVAVGDIDFDGEQEIVIGGYLWDNSQTSGSYNELWSNAAGELYLTYLEASSFKSSSLEYRALTVLGDDNGLAATRFISGNSDWESNYRLNGHNRVDTSIYLSDDTDNFMGMSRSPNWNNWEIPMYAANYSGVRDGMVGDQIFFDQWFYRLNGDTFTVYSKPQQVSYVIDDNNAVLRYVSSGQIWYEETQEFDGRADVFMHVGFDYQSHENGMMVWYYAVLSDTGSGNTDIMHDQVVRASWGNDGRHSNPPWFVGNFDYDTFYVQPMGHLFMYTDPTVVAVLAPLPYDSDMADILSTGEAAFGTTSFSQSTSTSEGAGGYFGLTIQGKGGFSIGRLKTSLNLYFAGGGHVDGEWTSTNTVTMTTEYSSPAGTVVATVVPTDVYVYKVYEPNGVDGFDVYYDMIPYTSQAYVTMFGYDEYNTMVDTYNQLLKQYDPDMAPIERIPTADNITGDLTSYRTEPTDPLTDLDGEPIFEDVNSHGSGAASTITTTFEISHSDETSYNAGFAGNLEILFERRILGDRGLNIDVDLGGLATSVDGSGEAYSTTFNNGFSALYKGEADEAEDVASQYHVTARMWAEKRTMSSNGEELEYVYIGYTVDDFGTVRTPGVLVPNVYEPDNNDESDPYNPTRDSICIKATLPDGELASTAERYEVQMRFEGRWCDFTALEKLGFYIHVGEDGNWSESDGVLVPVPGAESSTYVKVSGLEAHKRLEYEFRIVAMYTDVLGETVINPSLPVTAYVDDILVSVGHPVASPPYVMMPEGVHTSVSDTRVDILVDLSHVFEDGPRVLLHLASDIESGKRVNIWYQDDGGEYRLLAEDLLVYDGGLILGTVEDLPAGGSDDYALPGLIAVAVMVLIGAVASFAYGRR